MFFKMYELKLQQDGLVVSILLAFVCAHAFIHPLESWM